MVDDAESFANWLCVDDEYKYMELELKRGDHRKNNNVGDLKMRYENYRSWSNSKLANDVEKAVQLVPTGIEISVRDLKTGLKKYGYNEDYANKIVRECGSNDTRIKSRKHSYSSDIGEIRLERTQ